MNFFIHLIFLNLNFFLYQVNLFIFIIRWWKAKYFFRYAVSPPPNLKKKESIQKSHYYFFLWSILSYFKYEQNLRNFA